MEQFLQYSNQGMFLLRLVVAVIFVVHAVMKLKKANAMAVLGIVELLGAAGLALGLYTQIAALALGIVMLGAIYMKVAKWGYKFTEMGKTGWEFDLILLAANVVILTTGGGSIGV
ncbi:MAG: DoxX family protein [Patescibacteria group bacterium]